MMIGMSRDLRHMRDTEHLTPRSQRLQLASHLRRNTTTYADIDFVKDQRRHGRSIATHHQNRE